MWRFIRLLERQWRKFNSRRLTPKDILRQASTLGIRIYPDKMQKTAIAFIHDGGRYILFNPYLPQWELTLMLGHELGHHALGHITSTQTMFHFPEEWNPGTMTNKEKEASIIGQLCLIPTPYLEDLSLKMPLNARNLFFKLSPWQDKQFKALQVCQERLHIYHEYLELQAMQQGRLIVPA